MLIGNPVCHLQSLFNSHRYQGVNMVDSKNKTFVIRLKLLQGDPVVSQFLAWGWHKIDALQQIFQSRLGTRSVSPSNSNNHTCWTYLVVYFFILSTSCTGFWLLSELKLSASNRIPCFLRDSTHSPTSCISLSLPSYKKRLLIIKHCLMQSLTKQRTGTYQYLLILPKVNH